MGIGFGHAIWLGLVDLSTLRRLRAVEAWREQRGDNGLGSRLVAATLHAEELRTIMSIKMWPERRVLSSIPIQGEEVCTNILFSVLESSLS